MNEQFFINNLWRDLAGLPEEKWVTDNRTPEEIYAEIRHNIDRVNCLCENRLFQGNYRYNTFVHDENGICNFQKYDSIDNAIKRIKKFQTDNNLEHLIDARNMITLAFLNYEKQGYKFESIDDNNIHAKKIE